MTRVEGMSFLMMCAVLISVHSCCTAHNTQEIVRELHEINQKLPQPAVVETENG